MPSRVNVLLWCTAPPSRPTRKLVRSSAEYMTDASIINLTPIGDLLCQRPQGIEKRHQNAINLDHRKRPGQSARTLHVKIMQATKRGANAGNMRGFAPRRPDHARDIPLSFFCLSVRLPAGAVCPGWLLVRPRQTGDSAGRGQRDAQAAMRLLHPVRQGPVAVRRAVQRCAPSAWTPTSRCWPKASNASAPTP